MKKSVDRYHPVRKKRWLLVLTAVIAMSLPAAARQGGHLQRRKQSGSAVALCPARPRRKFTVVRPNRAGPARCKDDDEAVLESIRRISRVARLAGQDAKKKAGLTSAQLAVLRSLDGPAALSMNELANRTLTNPSSVSEVVARLVGQGMVCRTRSATDGRSVELSLTAEGRTLLANASQVCEDGLHAGLQQMPREERRQLSRLLSRLLEKVTGRGEAAEPQLLADQPTPPQELSEPPPRPEVVA